VEFTAFQVRATATTTRPAIRADAPAGGAEARRDVYWPELRAAVPTPTYEAVPAQTVEGPALIELADTVIAIRPGQSGRPDGAGNYVLTL